MESGSYARLEGKNFEFFMVKKRVVIGRNSRLGDVDVNMGSTRFISRRHLEILLERNSFFILCRGKNGVFVDDTFQRRENRRVQLPSSCLIRFPSTQIKFSFASLLDDMAMPFPLMLSPTVPIKVESQFYSPFVSPVPSPTGTISAVNSCPVSPNSDFRYRVPNFDLKAMATYASKLLSSQQQQQQVQGRNNVEVSSEGDRTSTSVEPCHVGDREAMPSDMGMTMIKDEVEEAGEVIGVLNDITTSATSSVSGGSGLVGGGDLEKSLQKPPYSYAQLIVQALLAAKDHRQTLSSIYSFISDMYPYYKMEDKGWKNSIRHNLSLNQYFMKAPREKEGLGFGKGGYWCMHPDYEDKLTSQAYVKRKKKGIPVFPSSHLISRSAPPSPTHHPTSEFPLKEITSRAMETPKFTLPLPPTTSHFALNTYFPPLSLAMNSSHSLPVSPSRPPPGLSHGAIKFFPLPSLHGLRAADDMDLVRNSCRKAAVCETIPESKEEGMMGKVDSLGIRRREERGEEEEGEKERITQQLPLEKRARMDENLMMVMDGGVGKPQSVVGGGVGGGVGAVPTHGTPSLGSMVALSSGMPSVQHTAVPGATGLQYIPISLMSTVAAAGLSSGGASHQSILRPPQMHQQNLQLGSHQLPPFLTPNFFNCGGQSMPHAISTPATVPLVAPSSADAKTDAGGGNGTE